MWDKEHLEFCLRSEASSVHLELVINTLKHGLCDAELRAEVIAGELQLAHYYESRGGWVWQVLRQLKEVDMRSLRHNLHQHFLSQGHLLPPLVLSEIQKKAYTTRTRYYPVDDGQGGPGAVFSCNAAALEYLNLDVGRMMLKAASSERQAWEQLRGSW